MSDSKFLVTGFVFTSLLTLGVASPAFASCTWYFNWSCSRCADMGGRSTGTQGGYPTYDSCNSARGSVDSTVTAHSCQSDGYCDSPAAAPSTGYDGGSGTLQQPQQQIYAEPQVDYEALRRQQETEQRRIDEEIRQREAEEKAAEEKRRRQFFKDKSEALGALKGVTDFEGSGGDLKIKNSSGDSIGIKDGSSAVAIGSDKLPVVHPHDIKGKPKNIPARDVPKQDVTRLGNTVANIVMDAIQENKHDLDKAYKNLLGELNKNSGDQDLRDAASYLLGMSIGHDLAGHQTPKLSQEQIARDKAAVQRKFTPFPGSTALQKWELERFGIYTKTLSQNSDNFSATREDLEKRAKADPNNMALRGALRIAQGAEVYQGDIDRRKTSGTLNR